MELRRRKAAKLFVRGHSSSDVAKTLGVSRQAAHRWKSEWTAGGQAALRSKGSAGPKSKLDARQTQQVLKALLAGPAAQGYDTQLWTLPRVAALIEKLTGVRYHPGHVWRLLGTLGFSCQRPERRALERDEKAIALWKKQQWPGIKKKRGKSAAPSCLSTKAG